MSESSKSTPPPRVTCAVPATTFIDSPRSGMVWAFRSCCAPSADAAKLGYNFLNVAGVEPLRYPGLSALCREAHRHGMLTSMITRDAALTAPQLAWLRFSIDLLGVEIERKGAGRNRRRSAAALRLHGAAFVGGPRRGDSVRDRVLPDLCSISRIWNGRRSSRRHRAPPCCSCGRPPELAGEYMATAWMKVECLCERSPRKAGHPLRRGEPLQPAGAARRPGLVEAGSGARGALPGRDRFAHW